MIVNKIERLSSGNVMLSHVDSLGRETPIKGFPSNAEAKILSATKILISGKGGRNGYQFSWGNVRTLVGLSGGITTLPTTPDEFYNLLFTDFFVSGSTSGFPGDCSTSTNQLAMLDKLQELINRPDYEILTKVGFDSALLEREKLGQITTSLFPGGGNTPPAPDISPINDTSFSWEVYNRSHWVLAPIDYNFSKTAMVTIYFKFENKGETIGLNRTAFFLQYQDATGAWMGSLSEFSGVSIQEKDFEIIQFTFDNSLIRATNFRVVIQEFGTNDDSIYPSNFQVDFLGLADKNASPITAYERYEDNMLISTEYRDVFGIVHTLGGFFIPDTSEKIGKTIQSYLIAIQEQLEQLNGSNLEKIKRSNDYGQTISYLDANDSSNRRPETIEHTSVGLGMTVTETFVYGGSSGDYYLIRKTLS